MLSTFSAPGLVSAAPALRRWAESDFDGPFQIHNVFDQHTAMSLAAAIRGLSGWRYHATVVTGAVETEEVDPHTWMNQARPLARHYRCEGVVDALRANSDQGEPSALRYLVGDLLARGLVGRTLADSTGLSLNHRPSSAEFAAYGPGDEIRPHQDLFTNRAFAINFYLDPTYDASHGNRLWYLRRHGVAPTAVNPMFNTAGIIRVREDAWHWVEPRATDSLGRHTVSVGIRYV